MSKGESKAKLMLRGNLIVLYVGKGERLRRRMLELFQRCISSKGFWGEINSATEEYYIKTPWKFDDFPVGTYYGTVCDMVKKAEEHNEREKANSFLGLCIGEIEIEQAVYEFRDKLGAQVESVYLAIAEHRLDAEQRVWFSDHVRALYVSQKDSKLYNLVYDLAHGKLEETPYTKRLYEMYDEGLI